MWMQPSAKWRLVGGLSLSQNFFLLVPVPLVDLGLPKTELDREALDVGGRPVGVLVEARFKIFFLLVGHACTCETLSSDSWLHLE